MYQASAEFKSSTHTARIGPQQVISFIFHPPALGYDQFDFVRSLARRKGWHACTGSLPVSLSSWILKDYTNGFADLVHSFTMSPLTLAVPEVGLRIVQSILSVVVFPRHWVLIIKDFSDLNCLTCQCRKAPYIFVN